MSLDTVRRIAIASLLVAGCAGQATPGSGDESDSPVTTGTFTEDTAIVGQKATVTASDGLNLRTGPSTSNAIILVMAHGTEVMVNAASNGWYKVDDNGHSGWCSGLYLTPVANNGGGGGGNNGGGGTPVADAMARAQSGVGFSYHWGGGCWEDGGAHGACYGSCPNCTHSGTWGADCSGYVAKVWQVPGKSATSTCEHPYSTVNFNNSHDHWFDVSRSTVKRGDAFVYNSGSEGHIFLYDSGDAWGWATAYECKGCSYGCVKDSRTVYSVYKPIRREGF